MPSGLLDGAAALAQVSEQWDRSIVHGPNEFLHVPYARKLAAAVAQVIARRP